VPAAQPLSSAVEITAAYGTAPLPDDPAIWIHPTDPARSVIIGTMKVAAPAGAVIVHGLDGQLRQTIAGIDRPNNVDIAIATERLARQLRIFRIDRTDGRLRDLGGIPILQSEQGEAGAPMGIALYRRERDGAVFAIVAPKSGHAEGYLWQYRLTDAGNGRPAATFVRRFGRFSGSTIREENQIEAVAVDDVPGYVYYQPRSAPRCRMA
jgi:3-phytase